MTPDEVALAVGWAEEEGWNPGLHDAQTFRVADPSGFLVGLLDEEPVASISVVAYDPGFAFLGFYIVRPEHRGQGHGMALWRAGMERLGARNVGLDGVVGEQDNYRRSGFRYAYANRRYESTGGGRMPAGIVDAAAPERGALHALDRRCFPAARAAFLDAWLAQPDARALAARSDGEVLGFGVIRRCVRGHKIGPLFARDAGTADLLYRALAATAPDEPVYLDVPEPNAEAMALARRYDMVETFETARMYTLDPPAIDVSMVFGVTSFELG
jgi:GNAT superfamily N-acetyltransferase